MSYYLSRDIPTYPKGACTVSYDGEGIYHYCVYALSLSDGRINANSFYDKKEKGGIFLSFHGDGKKEAFHEISILSVLIERLRDRYHHERKAVLAQAINGCVEAFFSLLKLEDISAEEMQLLKNDMMQPYTDKSELFHE